MTCRRYYRWCSVHIRHLHNSRATQVVNFFLLIRKTFLGFIGVCCCCSGLLDVYLQEEYLNIPTSNKSDFVFSEVLNDSNIGPSSLHSPINSLTLQQIQNNTLQVCLLLEGIGAVAQVFKMSSFTLCTYQNFTFNLYHRS